MDGHKQESQAGHVDGISRSCGWCKEILLGVLPMEQLVLSDKWARNNCPDDGHLLRI